MEASDGQVRGVVDTLVKVIGALENSGIELIGENASSIGIGRGVRLRETMDGRTANAVGSILFDKATPDAEAE